MPKKSALPSEWYLNPVGHAQARPTPNTFGNLVGGHCQDGLSQCTPGVYLAQCNHSFWLRCGRGHVSGVTGLVSPTEDLYQPQMKGFGETDLHSTTPTH